MKPVYLVNIVTNEYFEIPADNEVRTIGRSPECNFVTPHENMLISRIHGEIKCENRRGDGIVIYSHLSQKTRAKVFNPNKPNEPPEEIYERTQRQLLFGEVLELGDDKYRLKLHNYEEMKPRLEKEKQARTEDTQIVKNL